MKEKWSWSETLQKIELVQKNVIFTRKSKNTSRLTSYSREKIQGKCLQHNFTFEQELRRILEGRKGCNFCKSEALAKSNTIPVEDFKKSIDALNPSYSVDYNTYKGVKYPVTAICEKHGEWITQAYNLKKGTNCPKCASEKQKGLLYSNVGFASFVERSKRIHEDEYEYLEEHFTGMARRVKILCKSHGPFTCIANHHVRGQRCPRCVKIRSYGEYIIYTILVETGLEFVEQWSPRELRRKENGRGLRYDFYIPSLNIIIEFDGAGHFTPIKWSKTMTDDEAIKNLNENKIRDNIKNEWALKNGIKLYRLSDKHNLEEEVSKIINNDSFNNL